MRKILFSLLFIFSVFSLCAEELSPSSVKEINTVTANLEIKTNVRSAEVYINGSYEGRTNLLVTDLRPGFYKVEVRKNGFTSESFEIELRSKYCHTYKIDLKELAEEENL